MLTLKVFEVFIFFDQSTFDIKNFAALLLQELLVLSALDLVFLNLLLSLVIKPLNICSESILVLFGCLELLNLQDSRRGVNIESLLLLFQFVIASFELLNFFIKIFNSPIFKFDWFVLLGYLLVNHIIFFTYYQVFVL